MMSKMCVASDTKVCLERHNELCSDMIDIVTDFSEIYGYRTRCCCLRWLLTGDADPVTETSTLIPNLSR